MYALLIVWATSLSVLLLTRDHPNVLVRSRLTEIQPYLYLSGVLILLDAAGCRIYRHTRGLPPLLPRRTRIFCLLAFSLGLFCFLLYAALTASYSPPDSALPELSFPSAYTHEFSGTALLFCLVLALGLLSLIASFLVSSNHVPALKDILAVLGCLLAPLLCIFLLRAPEPETHARAPAGNTGGNSQQSPR